MQQQQVIYASKKDTKKDNQVVKLLNEYTSNGNMFSFTTKDQLCLKYDALNESISHVYDMFSHYRNWFAKLLEIDESLQEFELREYEDKQKNISTPMTEKFLKKKAKKNATVVTALVPIPETEKQKRGRKPRVQIVEEPQEVVEHVQLPKRRTIKKLKTPVAQVEQVQQIQQVQQVQQIQVPVAKPKKRVAKKTSATTTPVVKPKAVRKPRAPKVDENGNPIKTVRKPRVKTVAPVVQEVQYQDENGNLCDANGNLLQQAPKIVMKKVMKKKVV